MTAAVRTASYSQGAQVKVESNGDTNELPMAKPASTVGSGATSSLIAYHSLDITPGGLTTTYKFRRTADKYVII
jgi:hypothetical protein